jgi:hypothetical protein
MNAPPTKRAVPTPEATEPPSVGSRSETAEVALATPAATSTTTAPGASSAMPATQVDVERTNPTEGQPPSPVPRERWPPKGRALLELHRPLCQRS